MPSFVTAAVSIVFVIDGLGWGIGTLVPLLYALTYKRLPMVGPIRLLGGPFESLGIEALVAAGLVFVSVNAFKLMAAYWLWNSRMDGAVLGLVLLALSAVFWYGFALPLGPIFGLIELGLLAIGRATFI